MDTTPKLLAKVRLNQRGRVYLVVDVDPRRQTAELLSMSGSQHLVPDVPFDTIHELVEDPPDYL